MNLIKTETQPPYGAHHGEFDSVPSNDQEDAVIAHALTILSNRLHSRRAHDEAFVSADTVKSFLRLKIAELEHEVFGCLFLDTKHFLIADEIMFTGSISSSSVYPREVIKTALKYNAAAVIFYHNHPSGDTKPSAADRAITRKLKEALALIDITALDHIIIGDDAYSMVEQGEF